MPRKRKQQPELEHVEPQTTRGGFDYEAALERGKLTDEEIAAVVETFPVTTSATEIGVRLNLPPELVRDVLNSPATLQAIVTNALQDNVGWFSTAAAMKLRRSIESTTDPDLLVKLFRTMKDLLTVSAKFSRPTKGPGRPRDPRNEAAPDAETFDNAVLGE